MEARYTLTGSVVYTCTPSISTDCYFDQHFDKCYCDSCSSVRGDATISGRGSARYAIPKGWAMFGLMYVC